MKSQANVKLSPEERELVHNTEWILTKRGIIQKVVTMFSALAYEYRCRIQDAGKNDWLIPEAKISKGEQYERLPYVMLDFPRKFDKENVFAVRTFFWWGNYFSINLQLSGDYLDEYREVLLSEKFSAWFVCVNEDPWDHRFSEENFIERNKADDELLQQKTFIKLAKKIPLTEWDEAYALLLNHFETIIRNLVS